MPSIHVHFDWQLVGTLTLAPAGLVFPRTPDAPGLYRLCCRDEVYIGESTNLRRRMQSYRTPGPTQSTNIRLNAWIREQLGLGQLIELHIASSVQLVLDGQPRAAELSREEERVVAEHAALLIEHAAGRTVLNALGR